MSLYPAPITYRVLVCWARIHQALLSQFYLIVEFFIGKVTVKGKDSRVLSLVNLDPGIYIVDGRQ